jgi:hypothetical protein
MAVLKSMAKEKNAHGKLARPKAGCLSLLEQTTFAMSQGINALVVVAGFP